MIAQNVKSTTSMHEGHVYAYYSDHWTFGSTNLRNNEPSEQWTFGAKNLRNTGKSPHQETRLHSSVQFDRVAWCAPGIRNSSRSSRTSCKPPHTKRRDCTVQFDRVAWCAPGISFVSTQGRHTPALRC